ncbi:electron transport complex subunit RsxC [Thiomicrorhabdus cannonii]|uniref:electron transport complex subunit RsxC n=1 Tax=Thiomicrorhabdus cannonii TaxID=2748011 RepID=UPI0015BDCFC3|nr:electron transport complex subunit RsxC [Thiomicrorhabdus cannonii]
MGLLQRLAKLLPLADHWLHRFHGGVSPQYNKSLSASQPLRATLMPSQLVLPLQQPVGLPAEPIVQVGERVKKNQLLARAGKDPRKALVVPIHAPTSGTVTAIMPMTLPHPSGLEDWCIVLTPDGLDEAIDNALQVDGSAPQTPQALKDILLQAGIIGMGGAGFPTYAKIPGEAGKIHTLLVNGAECEPFITCDDLLMQTHADEIVRGALITAHALGAKRILCGIETNKPAAIDAMRRAAKQFQQDNLKVEIKEVATVYPMGGQKQLTYELTGVEMPSKAHAVDVGLLMMNVATYSAIYRAVTLGEPLTARIVTVSGLGLEKPFNMPVMIGTPFAELAEAAKPKVALDYPLVMGGPMMGFQVQNNQVPVLKTTNCILANPPEPAEMQMPCIRCGACMDACPVNLLPQQMYWHAQAHEFDKVEKLNVFDCIECGCCSYVCPSHIPLVQYYRHAKSEIKTIKAEAQAVELAKQRHEFKLARIEREKEEREARLKAKKEAVKQAVAQEAASETSATKDSATAAKSGAAAAAARAAAARKAKAATASTDNQAILGSSPSSSFPSARLKAIEAAKAASARAAKQTAENSPEETQQAGSDDTAAPAMDAKAAARKAAQLAAQKRAQAKATANVEVSDNKETADKPDTKPDPKAAAKAAAMKAAAKRREKTQQAGAEGNSEALAPQPTDSTDNDSTDNVKTAPVDLTGSSAETPASQKEAARKAAMAAAREAAKARAAAKKQPAPQATNAAEPSARETDAATDAATDAELDPAEAARLKREKAMQAAKARAVQKRQAADNSNTASDASSQESSS